MNNFYVSVRCEFSNENKAIGDWTHHYDVCMDLVDSDVQLVAELLDTIGDIPATDLVSWEIVGGCDELSSAFYSESRKTFDLERFVEYRDIVSDYLTPEIVAAAYRLGIDPQYIEESYCGEFKSDEDFAQDFAEQIGAIPRDLSWPCSCIDWEHAAKELMYDHCSDDGHYFRNI
jgi:antirestriction protein